MVEIKPCFMLIKFWDIVLIRSPLKWRRVQRASEEHQHLTSRVLMSQQCTSHFIFYVEKHSDGKASAFIVYV